MAVHVRTSNSLEEPTMANQPRDHQHQQGGQKDMKNQRQQSGGQSGKMDQSKTSQQKRTDTPR
jgi:hypothetical protein